MVNSEAVTTQRDGVGASPEPTELKFVGPATAAVIEDASFAAAGIRDREVSFGMLLDAGVNPGVAARIRREHSLPWSFDTEADRSDLDRRSDQVRGLNDGERDWVAASTGDWADDDPDETDTENERESQGTTPADTIDPRPEGDWPETARPDDTDDEPAETTAWPETARPETTGRGDTADAATGDTPSADEESPDDVGPWPATARPGGFASDTEAANERTDAPDTESDPDAPDTESDPDARDAGTTVVAGDGTGDRQATADGSGDPVQAETAWRERSAPVPVTELDGVDDETRETLAAAGITSVRSLATADPAAVAAALDLSEDRLATLRETARSFPD